MKAKNMGPENMWHTFTNRPSCSPECSECLHEFEEDILAVDFDCEADTLRGTWETAGVPLPLGEAGFDESFKDSALLCELRELKLARDFVLRFRELGLRPCPLLVRTGDLITTLFIALAGFSRPCDLARAKGM